MEAGKIHMGLSAISIPLDAMIARNNSFITMQLDDELACINEAVGSCIGLNATGRMIWEILESPLTVQEIIKLISTAFPDDDTTAIPHDILVFLANLVALNVVVIDNLSAETFS